ncbi:MAG: hypothetical protein V2A74_09635 [bacterium]
MFRGCVRFLVLCLGLATTSGCAGIFGVKLTPVEDVTKGFYPYSAEHLATIWFEDAAKHSYRYSFQPYTYEGRPCLMAICADAGGTVLSHELIESNNEKAIWHILAELDEKGKVTKKFVFSEEAMIIPQKARAGMKWRFEKSTETETYRVTREIRKKESGKTPLTMGREVYELAQHTQLIKPKVEEIVTDYEYWAPGLGIVRWVDGSGNGYVVTKIERQ